MVKIYTKTGDKGETSLTGGKREGKDSLRIEAYGQVDELNAVLGVCRAFNKGAELEKILHLLQRELFELGCDLSTPLDSKVPVPRIKLAQVTQLEKFIDQLDKKVDPLKNFILPGGGNGGAFLHLARTVCRRAERSIVRLQKKEIIGAETVKYINRLSDLLFMMARYSNKKARAKEEKWSGKN